MKKTLVSFVLIGLIFFGVTLPIDNTQAAENIPIVNKVQITSIGDNEYINYGQGQKYRVYASKNTTFKGIAYDVEGKIVPSGTTFYIYFDGALNNPVTKKEILCTVGNSGMFEGTTVIPVGIGQYSFWSSKSTHYYDIVTLSYYNKPNKTNPIPQANEKTVYHYAHGVYHP
ncbi:hypothetical protein BK784_07845 [Bacillus thuringiensis serovar medellin]|uniref:Uncharacterized protein n=1 Tax=Bacillus thuringiensis subsp. medellin TaxID=79672 RepID=A0A9X6RI15_BACTV|nr:hypothetical protein [Bacillus thuringiensis]OUC02668.1 hypothetical protein BK784_07845 [Bacillus thuringiensis serovar medellin]